MPVFASRDIRLKKSSSSTQMPTIHLTEKKQRVVPKFSQKDGDQASTDAEIIKVFILIKKEVYH